jgi:hypothetical protein
VVDRLLEAVRDKDIIKLDEVMKSDSWRTFRMIMDETDTPSSSGKKTVNWACRHCTFTNSHVDTCEMCGLPKD